MRVIKTLLTVLLIPLAFLAYFSLFIVHQTQQAVVLEFGKLQRIINADIKKNDANWYVKAPWHNVIFFDKRLLDLDARPETVIMEGNVPMKVDAFGRYKIVNPLKFYQSVLDVRGANNRLEPILKSSLRDVLGGASYIEVVRDKRQLMMSRILEQMNDNARSFGVKFTDVRIKRADLPDQNKQKVYERMKSERIRVAKKIRAEGNEQAQIIHAKADRSVVEIKAEANRKSSIIRGDGDAERNRIYAGAFKQDADFFGFYRSMEAYEKGLRSGNSRILMSPDSEFFRYFNSASGKR